MFSKLSLLVLVAPLVSALTISVSGVVNSGGNITINWTTASGDPSTWSFELNNPDIFHNALAIFNNVDPSLGTLTVQCPIVPASPDYTISAVALDNINQVFGTSAAFSIASTISSSGSAPLSTASTTGTQTGLTTVNSLPVTTPLSATGTSTSTGTGTGTGSAASTTPSNAAALSPRLALTNAGGYAILLLSAVAGAAAVAL